MMKFWLNVLEIVFLDAADTERGFVGKLEIFWGKYFPTAINDKIIST